MADDTDVRTREVLAAARARRERLRAAMDELERAAAAALPGREADWRSRLQRAATVLAATWDEHVGETEADDGSFDQILAVAPRLANTIERLRGDHDEVPGAIEALLTLAQSDSDAQAARSAALDLYRRLSTHRQLGADLFYEAYSVDIGPAD